MTKENEKKYEYTLIPCIDLYLDQSLITMERNNHCIVGNRRPGAFEIRIKSVPLVAVFSFFFFCKNFPKTEDFSFYSL